MLSVQDKRKNPYSPLGVSGCETMKQKSYIQRKIFPRQRVRTAARLKTCGTFTFFFFLSEAKTDRCLDSYQEIEVLVLASAQFVFHSLMPSPV